MHEIHLGTLDLDVPKPLQDVLGDPSMVLPSGEYKLIGRLDEVAKRFTSGALVKSLGNDQWFVHIVNVQQLASLAKSELVNARTQAGEETALSTTVGSETAIYLSAHLLGLGAGVELAGSLLEASTTALTALVSGVDPQSQRIAEKLSLEGVDPGSRGSVRKAISQMLEAPAVPAPVPETSFEPNRAIRSNHALEIER